MSTHWPSWAISYEALIMGLLPETAAVSRRRGRLVDWLSAWNAAIISYCIRDKRWCVFVFSVVFCWLDHRLVGLCRTCVRTVKSCLSWGGLPREPGYCQKRSRPSNPFNLKKLITDVMKVWRLAGVETIVLNLNKRWKIRINCFKCNNNLLSYGWIKVTPFASYFWVPKFHPPIARRVFRFLFLFENTSAYLSRIIHTCIQIYCD